jgi:heme exporter protein CcmD
VNDPHFGFVVAAYGLGFLIIAGMILSILVDYRSLKRALEKFSARQDQDNT